MDKLMFFVDIFVESPRVDEVVETLRAIPGVKQVFEVTGEFDIVTIVEADDVEAFREILKDRILKINGVKSTVSDVVLKAHEPKSQPHAGT